MSRGTTNLLCALAAAGILGAAAAAATTPTTTIPSEFSTTVTFAITYNADCTFTVAIEGGPSMDSSSPATSSATIPPGPYQVSVRTPLPDNNWLGGICKEAQFSMTGPGVSYSSVLGTDLGPYSATFNETFQPSSTYTMVDAARLSQPVTFTTTATGTSTDLLPPPPPPDTSNKGSAQQDLVGSAIVPFRGSLAATVTAAGTATVTSHGKPIAKLAPGRYDFVVDDESPRGGFFVQKSGKVAKVITGVAFKGRRTAQVTLTAGAWMFYARSAHPTKFVVS